MSTVVPGLATRVSSFLGSFSRGLRLSGDPALSIARGLSTGTDLKVGESQDVNLELELAEVLKMDPGARGEELRVALQDFKETHNVSLIAHTTKDKDSAHDICDAVKEDRVNGELCVGSLKHALGHGDESGYSGVVVMAKRRMTYLPAYSFIPSVRCLNETTRYGSDVVAAVPSTTFQFSSLRLFDKLNHL